MRTLADAMEGQGINGRSAKKAQKRVVECEPLGRESYQKLWRLAKGQDLSAIVEECAVLIEVLEQHLSGKERYDRAKTMRQNLKVRKQRFQDSDKKMLKLVINSIMQKYSPQQNLTSAESGEGMKYSEVDVAKAIAKFFEEWMGSRVGVQKWWGTEGGTAEDAWETMMDMDVSNIQDPDIREFVETAYLRSHRHFESKQEEDKIWDAVLQEVDVQDLRREMARFRANKAPGTSGVTIEHLKLLSDENLERLAESMNKVIMGGEAVPGS